MKKVILLLVLVLSLAGAIISYISYSTSPDTPPDYYNISTIHHGAVSPETRYYADGTHRVYIYEGIHPTGSKLMDNNGNMLEENSYKFSEKDGGNVLIVAETKYYTFWGQYHRAVALVLLIVAIVTLVFMTLTLVNKRGVAKA